MLRGYIFNGFTVLSEDDNRCNFIKSLMFTDDQVMTKTPFGGPSRAVQNDKSSRRLLRKPTQWQLWGNSHVEQT
jgi:hypothetical protein